MSSRVCSKCKTEQSVDQFRKCSKNKSGLAAQCRECYNRYMNQYYHSNADYRERSKVQSREARKRIRMEVMTHYSNGQPRCTCCGETEYEFLSVDHINKNGSEHRKAGIASKKFYFWLRNNGFPEGYRVLCMNCNFAIGVHGSCPHDKTGATNAAPVS